MEYIYITKACMPELYSKMTYKAQIAAQRFNYALAEGMANENKVHLLYTCDENSTERERIIENGNIIQYIFNNKNLFIRFFYILKKSFKLLKNSKDTVLIVDVLNYSDSLISCFVSKLLKRRSIAIVTDLPGYYGEFVPMKERSLLNRLIIKFEYFIINRFDKYILLTEQMKYKIKSIKSKEDYVVIEGIADINLCKSQVVKVKKNQIMYAGSLFTQYGIANLIQGFIMYCKDYPEKELNLVIYGEGDYTTEIEKISKKFDNIKFKGKKSVECILEEEKKSLLLVNPRPKYDGSEKNEYEQYSFPSKNIEYMSSGTPLLCTKLSGMPDEYLDYIYELKETSAQGIYQGLKTTLSNSYEDLINKGIKAKKFIFQNKTGERQFEKIYSKIIEK